MKPHYIKISGTEDGLDFDAHYTVSGWGKGTRHGWR